MRILSVSDTEIGFIYSPMIVEKFQSIDMVISCGDLPYYYLEYILSMLNEPLNTYAATMPAGWNLQVRGTHKPWGAVITI